MCILVYIYIYIITYFVRNKLNVLMCVLSTSFYSCHKCFGTSSLKSCDLLIEEEMSFRSKHVVATLIYGC